MNTNGYLFDKQTYNVSQTILEQRDRLNVYKLSDGKGPMMQALYERAEEYLKNHAANMRRFFINKVRGMIEWSIQEYERAKVALKGNITKYKELILFWAPEKVLTTQAIFKQMRVVLKDFTMWNMLDRKERKFIMKAMDFAEGRR
jgi:hypothetical protein